MENLNTIEKCFIATGRDPKVLPIVDHLPERDKKKAIADYQMPIVIEAINKGIPPDWANSNEPKYILWPDVVKDNTKPSGFGLSWAGYDDSYTHTSVGSRHTFRERAGARFFFDNFLELFEEVYL